MREYAFKHQILHQVTYGTVLKRTRRECHAKVAAWLAGHSGVRPNTFLGATAEHYEKAGDHERAAEYFTRAAEHARERYAHQEALDDVARALAMLDKASAQHAAGAQVPARMRRTSGSSSSAGGSSTCASGCSTCADSATSRVPTSTRCRRSPTRSTTIAGGAKSRGGEARSRCAPPITRRRRAPRGRRWNTRGAAGDEALYLRAKQTLALALNYLGDSDAGKALAEEGLAAARALGLRSIESRFLNALSIVASMREDMFLAVELSRRQLPIDRELGNPRDEAITLGNLGASLMSLGEHAEARQRLEEGLRLARAVGDRDAELVPLYMLSQCALRQGDAARAVDYARAGLDSAIRGAQPAARVAVVRRARECRACARAA